MTGAFALEADLRSEWIASAGDKGKRWDIIRRAYRVMLPQMLQHRVSPYFLDWVPSFTPIEMWAWDDIRCAGLPLYPQVPALHYFLDFADPVLQVVVELDGAKFHDKARDEVRDMALWAQGWRVFRIPGKRSLPTRFDIHQELENCQTDRDRLETVERWGCEQSEGFFWALKAFYYRGSRGILAGQDGMAVAREILEYHRLVKFPLRDGDDRDDDNEEG